MSDKDNFSVPEEHFQHHSYSELSLFDRNGIVAECFFCILEVIPSSIIESYNKIEGFFTELNLS